MFCLLLFVVAALCGCTHTETTEVHLGPWGSLDKRRTALGVGKYAALDLGNFWVVYATGFEPSTGWKHALALQGFRGDVPILGLLAEEPLAGGAAITPFIVSDTLPPGGKNLVIVRDARGDHEVPVEPPRDAMTTQEWSAITRR